MIKHQRVQMAPVAIRAQFWVRDSFSAGRLKSEIPAMTRAHYQRNRSVMRSRIQSKQRSNLCHVAAREGIVVARLVLIYTAAESSHNRTFITGALLRQRY